MEASFDRERVLNEIIEREVTMFLATKNQGGQAVCQQHPDTARLFRWMTHSVHSDAVLNSYLEDLRQAERDDRNLMVEKYARMDNLIPPRSQFAGLPELVNTEVAWQKEVMARFPHVLYGRDDDDFANYLSCELETMSDRTLTLRLEEQRQAVKDGRNMAQERYENLWHRLGRPTLAECERQAVAGKA